jgi:hypothetical protein
MARQRYIQNELGKLIPADEYYNPPMRQHYIMGDLQPYKSMIDGRMIEGRKQHREMLKSNNCIEIGNERQTPKPVQPPPGLKETLIRVANEKLRYT